MKKNSAPPVPEKLDPTTIRSWARLIRVSQLLLNAVEADLKSSGLPPLVWYDALLELDRVGNKGLRPYELQKEMLLTQYNLSRLVDRLFTAKLLQRRPTPDDGRGLELVITAAGRSKLKKMWPVYQAAIDCHFAKKLSTKDKADLSRILNKI